MAASWISRARQGLRPIGSVDSVGAGRVVGWAIGAGNVKIEAWIDGKCVARSSPGGRRSDVAAAYPKRSGALTSGFSLDLPLGSLPPGSLYELQVIARPSAPWLPSATLDTVQLAGRGLESALEEIGPTKLVSPFSRTVTDLVASRWPEDCTDLDSMEGQRRFVKRLKRLFAVPGVNALPPLADYARFLGVTLAHCRFVERHFPSTNANASEGASDFHCKPNSLRELFPIIHQLYVLRSNGVQGDFAEFGCFKGYSTSMLSFACQQLGITMHVFDSFEGLPPSEGSGYEAGQFAGSIDEVSSNVARFGAIDNVRFHKGFFSDTLREWRPPPLMCLWMDVDLERSARDLMTIADCVEPRGAVFSHECTADIFRGDEIISVPAPDNPVSPIVERFDELGRPLTGQYVAGYTGAFWARQGGIPVVDTAALFDLMSSLV